MEAGGHKRRLAMTQTYTYRCVCKCKFQMEIRLKRELDFEVVCVRTGCDLIMEPFLESVVDDNNG